MLPKFWAAGVVQVHQPTVTRVPTLPRAFPRRPPPLLRPLLRRASLQQPTPVTPTVPPLLRLQCQRGRMLPNFWAAGAALQQAIRLPPQQDTSCSPPTRPRPLLPQLEPILPSSLRRPSDYPAAGAVAQPEGLLYPRQPTPPTTHIPPAHPEVLQRILQPTQPHFCHQRPPPVLLCVLCLPLRRGKTLPNFLAAGAASAYPSPALSAQSFPRAIPRPLPCQEQPQPPSLPLPPQSL